MSEEQAAYNVKSINKSEGIIIRPGVSGVGKVNEDLPMTNPISPEQREEIQSALASATQGPWDRMGLRVYKAGERLYAASEIGVTNNLSNAHLVANAPEWISLLLSSEQAWREEMDEARRKAEEAWREIDELQEQLNQAVEVLKLIFQDETDEFGWLDQCTPKEILKSAKDLLSSLSQGTEETK